MKRRLNANTAILAAVAMVAALVGFDAVRAALKPRLPAASRSAPAASATPASLPPAFAPYDPDFRVGETAPDFTLPDRFGKDHQFSKLVRRDTLFFTTCGCSHCMDLQTYVGILLKHMGARAPDVITLTTMPSDGQDAWVRKTGLNQFFLYEQKSGPIVKMYRGHPCPRVFRLEPGLKVAWIGPSLRDAGSLEALGDQFAANLGFSPEEGRRVAPMVPAPAGAAGTP